MYDFENILKNYGTKIENAVEVYIKNQKVSYKKFKLKSLEIDLSIDNSSSVCIIEFESIVNPISKKLELNEEMENVEIGSTVLVKIGYRNNGKNNVKSVFLGYVFSIEIQVNRNVQVFVICSMDSKMWMMSSKRTELKKDKKKYSDIVKNTLSNYSDKFTQIEVSIKEEAQILRPIIQRDESDYEFLCRIANITGCIFYISLGKVFFTNLSKNKSKNTVIEPKYGVKSLKFKTNILGIPKEIYVNKLDDESYNKVIKSSSSSIEKIGDGKIGNEHTNNISNINTINILNNTAFTPEYAKFISQAEKTKCNINFVSCILEIELIPDFELGSSLTLKNFSSPIDNNYIIKGIKHQLNDTDIKTTLILCASCFSTGYGLPSFSSILF